MRKIVLLFAVFASLFSSPVFADGFFSEKGPILILGDSMTKGDLGRNLHQMLSQKTGRQIISIGIGGAGSADYVRPEIVNNCCGYTIRESAESSSKIEEVENSNVADNALVYQSFHGNLAEILEGIRPASVLIVLGTNQKNAHAKLVDEIRSVVPHAVITWAGPPLLSTSAKIYANLEVSLENKNVQIIRCDEFQGLGDPNETMVHYSGKPAEELAADTISQLK